MKTVVGTALLAVVLLFLADQAAGPQRGWHPGPQRSLFALAGPDLVASTPAASAAPRRLTAAVQRIALLTSHPVRTPRAPVVANEALDEVVKRTCAGCHSDRRKTGNLSLEGFSIADVHEMPETVEAMIVKLRAGMMPPPGSRTPGADTLLALVETLEREADRAANANPNPGGRTFQRLNRAEYRRSVQDLLALDVEPGQWLPLDTKSANFDNIADVQMPSAMVLDSYLDAASEIARLAVGNADASPSTASYRIPRLASQWDQVEGAPEGTRGGVAVTHTFPADGEYVFTVEFHANPIGELYGSAMPFENEIDVSVNGERVAVLKVDRFMSDSDPNGLFLKTPPIPIRAGPQKVSVAFVRTFYGPVNDLVAPINNSIADPQIGIEPGITNEAHMREVAITGPFNPTGVSDTPSRHRIFTCRPTSPEEERPCAQQIIGHLAPRAYRRPVTPHDSEALMAFYEQGREEGGFEAGIRLVVEAILASPHFILRFEEMPSGVKPGQAYRINDADLAARLSFFLWGTPPDEELLELARRGRLSDQRELERQTRRMLADPRSEALATRFAAQWLRLQDLDLIRPDAIQFPNFHEQLVHSMRRETELFFHNLVREDRSVLELFTADYTFVDDRLARHYGIPGVTGKHFRKVPYVDDRRRGLLGHGSVLMLTSVANRTSPVLRGKWVMEVLIGTPPPPPPPGVPDLEETEGAKDGRMLTTRERMEMHRASPTCRSCHQFMDPIGLALDNFDVTGQWRIRENGMPLDTRGDFYDGTAVNTPADLQKALLKRPVPLVRTFTENLMAYGLGRRVEFYDKPTVRAIARQAESNGYRMSEFVLGVVKSDAFRMKRAASGPVTEGAGQ